jgi:hypothetical protein
MFRWVVVSCLALAGCDLVFELNDPIPDDAGVDAPGGELPPLPAGCSPMSLLADDFQDNDLHPWWTKDDPDNKVVVPGLLVMDLTTAGNARVESRAFFDLREQSFTVRYQQTGGIIDQDLVAVELRSEIAGRKVTFEIDGQFLHARRYEGGTQFAVSSTNYDPSTLRFLRISNTSDATRWEYSSDGKDYERLGDVSSLPLSFVRPVFSASGEGYVVELDDVNAPGGSGQACPADALVDDFNSGMVRPEWANQVQIGCTLEVVNGELVGTFTDMGGNACLLGTSTLFDLRDHPFTVQVPRALLDGGSTQTASIEVTPLDTFGPSSPDGQHARFVINGGQLRAENTAQAAPYASTSYDSTTPIWLRIVHADGQLRWQISPDGITFEDFAMTTDFNLLSMDRVLIRLGISLGGETPGVAVFDNVNVP